MFNKIQVGALLLLLHTTTRAKYVSFIIQIDYKDNDKVTRILLEEESNTIVIIDNDSSKGLKQVYSTSDKHNIILNVQ
jgi:hypothetical protein